MICGYNDAMREREGVILEQSPDRHIPLLPARTPANPGLLGASVVQCRSPVPKGLCEESILDHFLIQCAGMEVLSRCLQLAVHQCRQNYRSHGD